MSFERATLAVGCDAVTVQELEEDSAFQRDIQREDAVLEGELKRGMIELAKENRERGVSVELRWLLEHQYPGIYGTRINQAVISPDLPLPELKLREADE